VNLRAAFALKIEGHRAYDARAAIVHSLAIAADMGLPVNAYMPERPVLRTRFSHELAREAGLSI
jgi:hypothetical protein